MAVLKTPSPPVTPGGPDELASKILPAGSARLEGGKLPLRTKKTGVSPRVTPQANPRTEFGLRLSSRSWLACAEGGGVSGKALDYSRGRLRKWLLSRSHAGRLRRPRRR